MNLALGAWLLAIPVIVVGYAYVVYPMLLRWTRSTGGRLCTPSEERDWPLLTIMLPVYNERANITAALERILELDYPAERRRVLVISDASTDGTDEIVTSFADRGVVLVRLPVRGGKTAAENAARRHVQGPIIVSTDASVRLHRQSLKPLVAVFQDPTVGIASGRDVSVGSRGHRANLGESDYVGYEMWVRDLETAGGGIVGASGCYYASRTDLHGEIVPEALSRDFAAPLVAREHGYRAVSVRDAICFVPRSSSLRREYRRKVRTMTRGLQTLFYKRHLMNPFRYGRFAWMLISHKLVRWLVPWSLVVGTVGAAMIPIYEPWARVPATLALVLTAVAAMVGWMRPERRLPRPLAAASYLVWGVIAGMHAWVLALRGDLTPTWEPTRRDAVDDPAPSTS